MPHLPPLEKSQEYHLNFLTNLVAISNTIYSTTYGMIDHDQ